MSTEKTPLFLLHGSCCSTVQKSELTATCDLSHENEAVCYSTLCVCVCVCGTGFSWYLGVFLLVSGFWYHFQSLSSSLFSSV